MQKLHRIFTAVVLGLLVSVGSLTVAPRQAQAQFVCANCSDLITQLMEYFEQLLQYAKQLDQYNLQIKQWEDMVRNSVKLPTSYFDNAISTIRGVEQTMQQGRHVYYNITNLNERFAELYPNVWEQMATARHGTFEDAVNRRWETGEVARDSYRTTIQSLAVQASSLESDQYSMDQIAGQLMDPSGRLDALQAAGQYAQHSAQQMMKMRQLSMVSVQLHANALADEQRLRDRRDAEYAMWAQNIPKEPVATPNTSSDYVRVP